MIDAEFASWVRTEHEKVHDLSVSLKQKVAAVPRANLHGWIAEIRDQFDHFRAHLTRHHALEEQGGFPNAVIERRPAMAEQVDRIQHEHTELARIMDGIAECLNRLTPDDRLLVRDCCGRIRDLLGYVEHHEDLENNLVSLVFSQDIGTKD